VRFIKIDAIVEDGRHKGYSLDADAYLRELPRIQVGLPHGARSFAVDAEHYDFLGRRCVKDLRIGRIEIADRNDGVALRLEFSPNQFKHDQGLAIEYSDVLEFRIDVAAESRRDNVWPATRRLGDVQLDEILPHGHGCTHEIQMTGGSLWVVAADLAASW
jgi:hypothetical protein